MNRLAFAFWLLMATVLAAAPLTHKPSAWKPGPTHGSDALAWRGFRYLKTYLRKNPSNTCTLKNAYRRKEWDSLRPEEKRAYVKAVQCLMKKPSLSGDLAPGAQSRFDDFIATHINQTLTIHQTGNFLAWHRYFVYTYETALRNECDYKGYQPYINWARLSNSVIDAPIFDGSDTSIGSNGTPDPQVRTRAFLHDTEPILFFDPHGAGGCIETGPFSHDVTANLGPVLLFGFTQNFTSSIANPRKDGLGYNPRCLRRDLSLQAALGTTDGNVTNLITSSPTLAYFQNYMQVPFQSLSPPIAEYGVHNAGHGIVGGDPGGDFFTSPGDPWFWFHHAQIDRVWWIWQNQNLPERWNEVAGTLTMSNVPPSRDAVLGDRFDLGVNDGFAGITIGDGVSTTGGVYCYVYE